jgi:Ser/Thr protein kinase RdoA (MazF antagonist)
MTTVLIPSAEQVRAHLAHDWGMNNVQRVTELPPSPGSVALFRIESRPRSFLYVVGHWGRDYWEQAATSADLLTKMNFATPRFIPTLTRSIISEAEWGECILRDWLPGAPIPRQELTDEDRFLLGRTLGKCHRLLAMLPSHLNHDWSDAKRGQLIDELRAAYQRLDQPDRTADDERILAAIDHKIALLEELTIPFDQLRVCPAQVIHSDFHPGNVLFNERRRIAGVIDVGGWSDYRIFEVIKGAIDCQSGAQLVPFNLSELKAVVSGYLVENDLSFTEIQTGINLLRRDLLWRLGGVGGYVRARFGSGGREPAHEYADAVIAMVALAEHLRDEGSLMEEALVPLVNV